MTAVADTTNRARRAHIPYPPSRCRRIHRRRPHRTPVGSRPPRSVWRCGRSWPGGTAHHHRLPDRGMDGGKGTWPSRRAVDVDLGVRAAHPHRLEPRCRDRCADRHPDGRVKSCDSCSTRTSNSSASSADRVRDAGGGGFGIGETSKVVLIFYTSVFIVTVSTIAATVSISDNKLQAAANLGAGKLQLMKDGGAAVVGARHHHRRPPRDGQQLPDDRLPPRSSPPDHGSDR